MRPPETIARPHVPREKLHRVFQEFSLQTVTRWSELDHALRLWGADRPAGLHEPPERRLLGFVGNAELTREAFHADIHQLVRYGLRFRGPLGQESEKQGEVHRNSTLASLAEAGVASDFTIEVFGRTCTVADVIRASAAEFTWDDRELEWTVVALALYLPQRAWCNKFNQLITFDAIAQRLCEQPLGDGACYGTHVPYALAVLLGADSQEPILSASARSSVAARLSEAADLLRQSQCPEGFWGPGWFKGQPSLVGVFTEDEALTEVVVTGHSLEWLAISPGHQGPEEEAIGRACDFLLTQLSGLSDVSRKERFATHSHACRALRCWFPEIWQRAMKIDQ